MNLYYDILKDDTRGFQFQGRGQSSLLPTKTLGLKTFVGCNRDSLWRFTSASRSSLAISSSLRTCGLHLGSRCLEKPSFELKYAPAKRQCINQRDQFGSTFML